MKRTKENSKGNIRNKKERAGDITAGCIEIGKFIVKGTHVAMGIP